MIEQVRDAKLHWILDQYLVFLNAKILNAKMVATAKNVNMKHAVNVILVMVVISVNSVNSQRVIYVLDFSIT